MTWQDDYKSKLVSVEEAAAQVKSGDRVWLGGVNGAPIDLGNALCARYEELENTAVVSGLLMYPFDFLKSKYKGHLNYESFFLGPVERKFLGEGNIKITSYQFSHTDYYTVNRAKCNVVLLEVSPPDKNGYMSFGPLQTFNAHILTKNAEKVIVQVNNECPYVFGGGYSFIHVSDVDFICEKDHKIPELPNPPIGDVEAKIASFISERIPDGACIQIGIGGVANAVCAQLDSKKDLGVHTEMLVEAMLDLAQKGVINGKKKNFHPNRITCAFGIGSRALYDCMDRNPLVETFPIAWVADPYTIAQNDYFTSVNNALTVDLTGQVCSESLGFDQFSGTGGQVDFVRGAHLSKGGQSFIALKSFAEKKDGTIISRIVSKLDPGTVVTTPRTDVQYIVTENGLADLKDRSIPDRVRAMIAIAHPAVQDQLWKEAKEAGYLFD